MRKQNTPGFSASASANRPVSRMSTATSTFRAASRMSVRTTTTARLRSTHVQKIAGLLRNLVQQVTGVGQEDDPDEFQEYVAGSLDTVLNSMGAACDLATVTKRIAGYVQMSKPVFVLLINVSVDIGKKRESTSTQTSPMLSR